MRTVKKDNPGICSVTDHLENRTQQHIFIFLLFVLPCRFSGFMGVFFVLKCLIKLPLDLTDAEIFVITGMYQKVHSHRVTSRY